MDKVHPGLVVIPVDHHIENRRDYFRPHFPGSSRYPIQQLVPCSGKRQGCIQCWFWLRSWRLFVGYHPQVLHFSFIAHSYITCSIPNITNSVLVTAFSSSRWLAGYATSTFTNTNAALTSNVPTIASTTWHHSTKLFLSLLLLLLLLLIISD